MTAAYPDEAPFSVTKTETAFSLLPKCGPHYSFLFMNSALSGGETDPPPPVPFPVAPVRAPFTCWCEAGAEGAPPSPLRV